MPDDYGWVKITVTIDEQPFIRTDLPFSRQDLYAPHGITRRLMAAIDECWQAQLLRGQQLYVCAHPEEWAAMQRKWAEEEALLQTQEERNE